MRIQRGELIPYNQNGTRPDRARTRREGVPADVLFEQLVYLIEFADGERERLERVKAILLETFA